MNKLLPNPILCVVFVLMLFSFFSLPPGALAASSSLSELESQSKSGDKEAQNLLGVRHFTGDGLPKNSLKAAELFTRSARQGLAKAQFNLAYMYHKGIGVSQSYTQACVWYDAAARQGHSQAKASMATIEKYMNPEKLQEVRRLSAQIPSNASNHRVSALQDEFPSSPEAMTGWLNSIEPAAGK